MTWRTDITRRLRRARAAVATTFMLSLCLALPAAAQERVFVFGNSLVHHLSDSDETTVPHWLALLARAGGHDLALDGQWGFLRDHANGLPPIPNWSFDAVTSAWDADALAFRRVGFDTIVVTPANFIQYQSPDAPYDGDNPNGDSPLDATIRLLDWTGTHAPGARILIYEGWAKMDGIAGFPPDAGERAAYLEANGGAYADWYRDYTDALRTRFPDRKIRPIPVASVLAAILSEPPLDAVPSTDLWVDDAPHGTANLYFLAALATYATLYGEAPPAGFVPPETLHPAIRENYDAIAARVWEETSGATLPAADRAAATPGTLADPSLSMGLAGIADWSTQHPFIDEFKSSRPWIGHTGDDWGAWPFERLVEAGHIGPDGWPVSLPEDTALEAFVLTDQPPGAVSLAGRYRVTWAGQGDLTVVGLARDVARDEGGLTFDYRPGSGTVAIRIEATDPADPIRDIAVVREDLLPLHEAGEVFDPDWIARIADLRAVRFMDWMDTNGSEQVDWSDRPRPGDATFATRGVPVEVMVRLANTIGADPWFTLPHMADDAYVAAFADIVRDTLDPRLRVHAEWSNEVWNFQFPQAHWAAEQARALWGEGAPGDAWMQFAGLRAAQVADIWAETFADAPDRLIRVVAVHTGWLGLEEPLLTAPLAVAEGAAPPVDSFDAYAVTGYFGFEIGGDDMADTLRGWIADGTAAARVTDTLRAGSFADLTGTIWPHHAGVAASRDLALVMYEGGTHVVGQGAQVADDALTAFFTDYNYGPDMALLYADLLTEWSRIGDGPFNAFVDVAAPSRFGSWGALRHLDDTNSRWATLSAFGAVPFGDPRAAGTFLGTLQGAPE